MKLKFLQPLILFALFACSQPSKFQEPVIAPSKITKDLMSWLYYERDYMVWPGDFVALDTTSKLITKKKFLDDLTTGNYLPVKIKTADSSLCYKLYKINDFVDKGIREVIKAKAQVQYKYFNMEGKPLPQFHFVDLDGNVYDAATTKGKIVVLNCWFIDCKPCNEEIPSLNRLVKQLEDRKDILFVSLAFDPAEDLKDFLKKTAFKYAIVPNKEDYLMNDLRISGYPTHLIINRQGMVAKVIDGSIDKYPNAKNFMDALNKEMKNVH